MTRVMSLQAHLPHVLRRKSSFFDMSLFLVIERRTDVMLFNRIRRVILGW
jgi:hypothetical protein